MPILPQEPDVYPSRLLDDTELSLNGTPWWVVYTLSRREKDLMRRLRSIEVPHYCPLIPKKTKSPSGRVRTSYSPLFAGYVFVQADVEQRLQTLQTNCVSRTLQVTDPSQLIEDLARIQQLIEADVPLTIESRIQPGQPVRVISGPFQGIEGVVLERRGIERLLVSVRFLQQGASVAIEDFQVELI